MVLEADDDHGNLVARTAGMIPNSRSKASAATWKILCLFADGSVRVMHRKIAPAEFYKLLTIAGGEVISDLSW